MDLARLVGGALRGEGLVPERVVVVPGKVPQRRARKYALNDPPPQCPRASRAHPVAVQTGR